MKLTADEKTVPRLHLIGTIMIVCGLAAALGLFFTWQFLSEHRQSLARIELSVAKQQQARLEGEMRSALGYIQFVRSRTEEVLRRSLVQEVDSAMQIVEAIHARESSRRSPAEVKRLIIETLRPVRFYEGRGYYFIDGMDGQCILLPTTPKLEGTSFIDNRDDTGHYIMRGLIEAAKQPRGEGFSTYRWYAPDSPKQMAEKLSYVRHFKPYDWVIGTGDYLYKWDQLQQREALERLRSVRFGKSGYIGVLDRHGRSLLSPSDASLEGRLYSEMPERERTALASVMQTAKAGGGFVTYSWKEAESDKESRKTALVKVAEPWGWVLVATVVEDELQAAINEERAARSDGNGQHLLTLAIAMLVAVGVALAGSLGFSRWSGQLFRRYHEELEQRASALRKQAEQLALAAKVFESGSEAILISDHENRVLTVNRAFTDITGYEPHDIIGKTPSVLASGQHPREFYDALWDKLKRDGVWSGEIWNRRRNGELYPEWLNITVVYNEDRQPLNYIAAFMDISERKEAEDRIRRLAETDTLTGLPNRFLFSDRLGQAVASAERNDERLAVLFVDLDRFKNINDSLGHPVGDEVLRQVAARLRSVVRASDTVSRVGGDEFVILLPTLDQPEQVLVVAQKLIEICATPFHIDDYDLTVTPSIGIALYPEDGKDMDTLLKNADSAMYHAKSLGRNNFQFFTSDLNTWVTERLELENGLRRALAREELFLVYQPKVDLASGRIVGCEALVRWRHPERGTVTPDRFIPLAEETGLIVSLGQWVLDEACRQLRTWDAAGFAGLSMAVNVSVVQLRHTNIAQAVRDALKRNALSPDRLELEVTESIFLGGNLLETSLQDIAGTGVSLALDDFGTGYSSLSYLSRRAFGTLKIDRSFVNGLPDDADGAAVVRSILSIAHDLGMQTVAEGVENAAQLAFLRHSGCQLGQGYHFAKPLEAAAFEAALQQARDDAGLP